jgi:hypothetical protein
LSNSRDPRRQTTRRPHDKGPFHLVNVHLVPPAIVELVVRVEAWFAMAAAVRPFLWYAVIPVARKGMPAPPRRCARTNATSAQSAPGRATPHGPRRSRRSRRARAPDGALTRYFRIEPVGAVGFVTRDKTR